LNSGLFSLLQFHIGIDVGKRSLLLGHRVSLSFLWFYNSTDWCKTQEGFVNFSILFYNCLKLMYILHI
jgi:hypothetical protein